MDKRRKPAVPALNKHPGTETPDQRPVTFSRRAVLALGGAAAVVASTTSRVGKVSALASTPPPAPTVPLTVDPRLGPSELVDLLQPEIAPRSAWAQGLPVVGEIVAEDDVRFLLVHHTASRNDYRADEVIDQIRDFYGFHTGPDKGWPDVAYNFFIDRFGGIWEARAGSIEGAVRGDATGGSQGFAMLCSLIGDHSQVEVSPEALDSLNRLLAWLAERHQVDTNPGATIDFVSRGSNRWPAGTGVTAATISGHRDMSQTACPGDFAYGLLSDTIPTQVTEIRTAALTQLETAVRAAQTTWQPDASSSAPTDQQLGSAPSPGSEQSATAAGGNSNSNDGQGSIGPLAFLLGGAAALTAALAAGAARFRRTTDY